MDSSHYQPATYLLKKLVCMSDFNKSRKYKQRWSTCQTFQLKRPGSCDPISCVYYNELCSDIKFLEKVTSSPKMKIHTNVKWFTLKSELRGWLWSFLKSLRRTLFLVISTQKKNKMLRFLWTIQFYIQLFCLNFKYSFYTIWGKPPEDLKK